MHCIQFFLLGGRPGSELHSNLGCCYPAMCCPCQIMQTALEHRSRNKKQCSILPIGGFAPKEGSEYRSNDQRINKNVCPQSLTWNLKMAPWNSRFLLETIIFRFPSLNLESVCPPSKQVWLEQFLSWNPFLPR